MAARSSYEFFSKIFMIIREARLEDVDAIRDVSDRAFRKLKTVGFDGIREKDSIEYFIKSDDFRVYVVEEDGRIIGFGMLRVKNVNKWFHFDRLEDPPIKDRENYAYLMYIAINPEYQGRGYGKKLMKFLLEEAKRLGKKGMFGEFTTASPGAIRLAEEFGGKKIVADVWYRFDFD